MSKKMVVVGAKGHWGRKITQDLMQQSYVVNEIDIQNQSDIQDSYLKDKNDIVIVAIPPEQHGVYVDFFMKPYRYVFAGPQKSLISLSGKLRLIFQRTKWLILYAFKEKPLVLCEKPFPEFSFFEINKHNKNIRIVDHYLYKKNIINIKKYFEENRQNIKEIQLHLCEKNKEQRNWMFDPHQYGGVIFDLAHHLVAILAVSYTHLTLPTTPYV